MTFLITPIIFLIHIAEEWRHFPAWATRHFGATSRAWFVYSHIFLVAATFGISWMATVAPSRIWTILAVAVQWGLFTNAIFHFATWRLFKEYSPGLFTAVLLFVPITIWLLGKVSLDGADIMKAIAIGSVMGGAAVASLWLDLDIGWNLRRKPKFASDTRNEGAGL
jgi:hypothetical protein